jgi:FkbM family methyltransferase
MRVNVRIQDAVRQLKYIYRFGQASAEDMLRKLSVPNSTAEINVPGLAAPVLVRTGTSDISTFDQIFVELQYQLNIQGFNPEYIIDGGANAGYSTLYFASRYPHAKIVAVEPEPSNYEILRRNVASYENITPLHAALWNKKMLLNINNPGDDKNAFRVQQGNNSGAGKVQALAPLDIMEAGELAKLDILKLDIEGAEKELFDENSSVWLDKTDLIIIELHDWFRNGCGTAFYNAITPYGFSQINKGENAFVRLGKQGFVSDIE